MKRKKLLKLIIPTILIMQLMVGCSKLANNGEIVESNRIQVTQEDLTNSMKSIETQLESAYGSEYKSIKEARELYNDQQEAMLESLISENVIKAKAEDLGVYPDEDMISKKEEEVIETMKTVYGQKDADKATLLKTMNYTEDSFKQLVIDQIVYDSIEKIITKDVPTITDAMAQDYYNQNKELFKINNGMEVSQVEFESQEDAQAALSELQNGRPFDEIVAKYNPNKAETAGYVGFIEYDNNQIDETFMKAIKPLKEGEISNVINTNYGIHIVKALKPREASYQEFDQIKESLMQQLKNTQISDAYDTKLKEWKEDYGIKTYPKNLDKLK